jgi:hypothetical protein
VFGRFLRIESPFISMRGIMHQPVEDTIGKGWVADLFMPARDRELDVRIVERTCPRLPDRRAKRGGSLERLTPYCRHSLAQLFQRTSDSGTRKSASTPTESLAAPPIPALDWNW